MKHIAMRKKLSFLLAGACVSLSSVFGQTEPLPPCPYLVVVGTNTVEMGGITCEESKTVPFRLRNVCTNQVKIIALVPTCHCITGTSDKMELAPNEEAVVSVTLDPTEISGHFHRGLWVKTGLQKKDLNLLSLTGEAIPLFTGGPESPIVFLSDRPGVTLTNRYTLTAVKPRISLGAPALSTDGNMSVTATLTTNTFETLSSYELALILKPNSNGFHTAVLRLPIVGPDPSAPIKYVIQARVGAKLTAAPSTILLVPAGDQSVQVRLRLTAETPDFSSNNLTWSPPLEGLSVAVSTNTAARQTMMKSTNSPFGARKKSSLFVTLTLSPAAVTQLMTQTDPELRFQYPAHEPVTVRFVTQ